MLKRTKVIVFVNYHETLNAFSKYLVIYKNLTFFIEVFLLLYANFSRQIGFKMK